MTMQSVDQPPRRPRPGGRREHRLTWHLATLMHQIAYIARPLTKTTAAAQSLASVALSGTPHHHPPWLTALVFLVVGQAIFYIRRGTQQLSGHRLDPSSER